MHFLKILVSSTVSKQRSKATVAPEFPLLKDEEEDFGRFYYLWKC